MTSALSPEILAIAYQRGSVFFTQITMEAAEDPEFLEAIRRARIKGAALGSKP